MQPCGSVFLFFSASRWMLCKVLGEGTGCGVRCVVVASDSLWSQRFAGFKVGRSRGGVGISRPFVSSVFQFPIVHYSPGRQSIEMALAV
ncbi:hypothetical protein DFP73DRAFT_546126 [Morchella snyderi]|nr:hypothetical protein DFP73DRAFT_546126 [Morchella snyderi]